MDATEFPSLKSGAISREEENTAFNFPGLPHLPPYQSLVVTTQLQMQTSEGKLCQTPTALAVFLHGPDKTSPVFFFFSPLF